MPQRAQLRAPVGRLARGRRRPPARQPLTASAPCCQLARRRLRRLAGRRWTKEGALVIQVDETRHQARNREIARARLADLVRRAAEVPKRRVATKPTYGSKQRRLKAKKVRGDVKAMRGRVEGEE